MWVEFNSLLLTDGYKPSHKPMYPVGTAKIYSNFTPRSDKHAPWAEGKLLNVGVQKLFKDLIQHFDKNFFNRDRNEVAAEIAYELSLYQGSPYDVQHVYELHDYGRLPFTVRAIEEGILLPIKVPSFTVENTMSINGAIFHWVTNYLETIMSCEGWLTSTAASLAFEYRKILTVNCLETNPEALPFVKWQGHDFSMRGMGALGAAINAGIGHAFVFDGSDTLPVIPAMRYFYGAKGFVIGSVPATEHSVMCAGGQEDEISTFLRLMRLHPANILSIVSDTWNLWVVLMHYAERLKPTILRRGLYLTKESLSLIPMEEYDVDWNIVRLYFIDKDGNEYTDEAVQAGIATGVIQYTPGKIVFRPDSGNPADIVCGLNTNPSNGVFDTNTPQYFGAVELLDQVFGHSLSSTGFKVLDPHVGIIYGDSITLAICTDICNRLKQKGYASTNVVFGIGSFTYQYNTRDTFGWAMKATAAGIWEYFPESDHDAEAPGMRYVEHTLFKNPITDDGTKKSAYGFLKVVAGENGTPTLICGADSKTLGDAEDLLQEIIVDGQFVKEVTMEEIRAKVDYLVDQEIRDIRETI